MKRMCLQIWKYMHNLTDVGSSFVVHNQVHFAVRMAQLQPRSVFLTLSPLIAPHAMTFLMQAK